LKAVRLTVYKAYNSGEFTLKEIADHRGVQYSTVSRIVSQLEAIQNVALQDWSLWFFFTL